MYTSSLTDLIAEVRTRTNTTGDQSVTDTEITGYLNRGIAKWQLLVIKSSTQDYFFKKRTLTITSGTALYDLDNVAGSPIDFFKLIGVSTTINGYKLTLKPFMENERDKFAQYQTGWSDAGTVFYRLRGAQIEFIPTPTANTTCDLLYIPVPTKLGGAVTSIDGIASWDEYAVLDASYKVATKRGINDMAQLVKAEQAEMHELIESLAAGRDVGSPERVQDVMGWPED